MKFCLNCGHQNDDSDERCSACGGLLRAKEDICNPPIPEPEKDPSKDDQVTDL